jgi:hypothetical protein
MPAGRPLKFPTVEDLQAAIDEYFADKGKPTKLDDGTLYWPTVTVTGLALALDTTRETLLNYQDRPEFSDAITRAKLRCEHFAETMLYNARSAQGPIFALKNFGWRDSQDVNLGGQKDNPVAVDLQLTASEAYQRLLDSGE